MEKFSENLKRARTEKNLSVNDLADKTGINYNTYVGYEAGNREPPYAVLVRLAEFLEVSCDELLGHEWDEEDRAIAFLQRAGMKVKGSREENRYALGLELRGEETPPPCWKDTYSREEVYRLAREAKKEIVLFANLGKLFGRLPCGTGTEASDFNARYAAMTALAKTFFISDDFRGEPKTFNGKLKWIREKMGLSAKEIAMRAGVNVSTYAGYENSHREPGYETLVRLAEALWCSVDELLGCRVGLLRDALKVMADIGIFVRKEVQDHREKYVAYWVDDSKNEIREYSADCLILNVQFLRWKIEQCMDLEYIVRTAVGTAIINGNYI